MTNKEKQEFLIAFGNRVRKIRTEKQMSLDELARKCGYTSENARSSIQKIEAGKSDIPASKIRLIANALGVTEAEIMGWDEMYDVEKISKGVKIFELIEEVHGKAASEAATMYAQLDIEDQAEIRGEMKQMLKAEKYSTKEGLKNA